ncbi:MAG: lycopene cyclase domain-containing protein [Puniceicoccales bacterium]
MTYWQYHLLFTVPPLIILLFLLRKRIRPAHCVCWLVLLLIVLLFTTPWDNYAVYLGIWGFGENVSLGYPALGSPPLPWFGQIPLEEYAFFIIESTLICLVCLFFLPRKRSRT